MSCKDVVIIGAPRSGTNMLRDVMCSLEAVETWPCDEINYIWRHGNAAYPSDAIPVDRATPRIKRFIQKAFSRIRAEENASVVVEKTCANSLRVPFVDAAVPDAKYIFIYRDGIDATGSAKLRWTAKLDWPYLRAKIRYVPVVDLPYYALRYFWHRFYRLFSAEKRLAFWGPKLDGMQEILQKHSLNEVCAIQWQQCVEHADQAFQAMPAGKVLRIRYEDFVAEPLAGLLEIIQWLDLDVPKESLAAAVASVSSRSVGKGRKALGVDEVAKLQALIGPTLEKFGYE